MFLSGQDKTVRKLSAHMPLTKQQTDRQAGRQTGRQAGRQTGRQAGRQTNRQAGRQADMQAERQTDIQLLNKKRMTMCGLI